MFDPLPLALEACVRCPRLVAHRQGVADKTLMRRAAYAEASYWGKPVPGFGDPRARILLLGLAPGAHGSNRTGRMFTGDASGDFLFPALYRAGLASQPTATDRNDGLLLRGIWITAACRCVPPGNKPLPAELANCQTWLSYDAQGLSELRVVLALGRIAHDSYLTLLKGQGRAVQKSRYPFKHGALHHIDGALPLLDSYHVSYQNTNTGKLTVAMFDALLSQAKALADL